VFTNQLSMCFLLLFADPEGEHRFLIQKHQQYLQAIHSLEVEVKAAISEDGGHTWKLLALITWRKDGPRHRFNKKLYAYASPTGQGLTERKETQEFYTDANESRELWTPLPSISEPLSPNNKYGHVRAAIGDPSEWIGNHGPPAWLFFTADQMFSLVELDRLASSKRLLRNANIDGRELVGIEVTNPRTGWVVTAYLDPLRSYAIASREMRTPPLTEAEAAIAGVQKVMEWREVKPGIPFPMHVRSSSSDQPARILDVRVLSLRLNEPVAEELFAINFPRGAKVRNGKSGEVYIWGENEPARTFANQDEFLQWEREQMGYGPGRTLTGFVLANGALLTLVVAIVLVRRRYTRRAFAA